MQWKRQQLSSSKTNRIQMVYHKEHFSLNKEKQIKQMHIVYIIEDYSENGGVERIVSMKANTLLQQYHHQVTLISVYDDSRPQQYALEPNITFIQLHVPFAKKAINPITKLFSRIHTLLLAAIDSTKNSSRSILMSSSLPRH